MTSEMWIFNALFIFALVFFFVGAISRVAWFVKPDSKSGNLYQEVLPFLWINSAYIAFYYAVIQFTGNVMENSPGMAVWDLVLAAVYVYFAVDWYKLWKNEGDGRWKKRAKKALGVVQVAGHKLVVVPETAEVRA